MSLLSWHRKNSAPYGRADGLVLLAAACEDGSVRVYDAESCISLYDVVAEDAKDLQAVPGSWMATSTPMKVAFSCGGTLLAVASGGPHICLYSGLTGALVLKLLTAHSVSVSAMAWHADGITLAAGYTDGNARLWGIPERLLLPEAD